MTPIETLPAEFLNSLEYRPAEVDLSKYNAYIAAFIEGQSDEWESDSYDDKFETPIKTPEGKEYTLCVELKWTVQVINLKNPPNVPDDRMVRYFVTVETVELFDKDGQEFSFHHGISETEIEKHLN